MTKSQRKNQTKPNAHTFIKLGRVVKSLKKWKAQTTSSQQSEGHLIMTRQEYFSIIGHLK